MRGLQAWQSSIWFGLGPGEHSWYSVMPNHDQSSPMESHNITIDLLTQGGVLAGLAWIGLVLYLMIGAWRIRDAYTFCTVLMMATFTLFHNTRQPYFWFVLAMAHEVIRRKLFVPPLVNKV